MVKIQVSKRALPLYCEPAPEHPNPDLLEQVFGHLALVRQEHEVAHQAVLIGLDELVEQLGVLPFQAAGYRSVLTLNLAYGFGGEDRWGLHVLNDANPAQKVSLDLTEIQVPDLLRIRSAAGFRKRFFADFAPFLHPAGELAGGPGHVPYTGRMEVLYGLHPVEEALRARPGAVDHISVAREREDRRDPRLARLLEQAARRASASPPSPATSSPGTSAPRCTRAWSPSCASAACSTSKTCSKPRRTPPARRFFLALDGVEDPHNLGALLRSADGAGVDGVILPERRSAPLSAVVAKSSAGASEHVRIARVTNLTRALEQMKKAKHLDRRPRRARNAGLHRLRLPPGLLPRARPRRRRAA